MTGKRPNVCPKDEKKCEGKGCEDKMVKHKGHEHKKPETKSYSSEAPLPTPKNEQGIQKFEEHKKCGNGKCKHHQNEPKSGQHKKCQQE